MSATNRRRSSLAAVLMLITLSSLDAVLVPRVGRGTAPRRSAQAAALQQGTRFEWPVRIASGPPDGSVWVGIATDVFNWGGVYRFTTSLTQVEGWGLNGAPEQLSVGHATGDVLVEEAATNDPQAYRDRVLARFRRDGRHQRSWPAPEGLLDADAGPLAGGEGVFALYEDPATARHRVLVTDGFGQPINSWEAVLPPNTEGATALAATPSGELWVAFRHVFTGTVRRFTADGQPRDDLMLGTVPVALDVDAAGRIFVASISDLPWNVVSRFNADGSRIGECEIADTATLLDIAAAPDGGFYLLLRHSQNELRHYDAACRVLARRQAFGPVLGTPHPPTATQAAQSPTPYASTTPTRIGPPTPVGPTASSTATPGIPPSETPGTPPPTASDTPPPATPSPTPPGRVAHLPLAIKGRAMAEIVQPPAILVIPEAIDPADWPADPFTIREARVEGSLLKLAVRFGGGCQPHDFGLVASSLFMESNPVQADLLLTHDAHGDMCRALLYRDLVLDLRPLRRAYEAAYPGSPGPIILRLRGWLDPLSYAW